MEQPELDWIVEKASELLSDKVAEAPLKEEDVDLAFKIFAEPRLRKVSKSFDNEEEYTKAVNYVRVKLHEKSKELNEEHWSEE
ncbi:MAG: hypothetical protein KGY45_01130 [Hadesarchaea archaeon]|nr:hypothetical protein [Hadesarchaea archaeon]